VQPLRSMLFVPGNKFAWMEKALRYGADALIFDLEDAVPAADKAAARNLVRDALEQFHTHGPTLTVRINALETGTAGDDLEAVVCPALAAIVAPKVETPQDIAALDTLLTHYEHQAGMTPGHIEILPTLETARGIYHAYHIATCSPRVPTLVGTAGKGGDTARSLGYLWSKGATETLFIRSKVLLEARAAACPYPLIASWFDIKDIAGLRADGRLNRQIGFAGQVVIHPSHVPIVNDIFTPSAEEIAYYQGVVEAMEKAAQQGTAAVTYDGGMVDIAMLKTAQQVIAFARQIGARQED
jgi:citrate lyase subunit beta/citryl-CoA lyase